MYDITELAGVRNRVCSIQPRLFFAIHYAKPGGDRAFEFAAQTWLDSAKALEGGPGDRYLLVPFSYESEFKLAWAEIALRARKDGLLVQAGSVFSHASKQIDRNDGLEMLGREDDGTLKGPEILALPKLPWADSGAYLVLTGCNTGMQGKRGWAPASAFAQGQGVPTLGQAGFAYFSKLWPRYLQKSPGESRIVLWAYRRARNSLGGSGARIPGVLFHPPVAPVPPAAEPSAKKAPPRGFSGVRKGSKRGPSSRPGRK